MSAVKRWHMIETTRIQTLAEHTANVGLLAWTIAHNSPGTFFQPLDVLLSAMVHDLAEVFLGDIPTHSKPLIGVPAIKAAESQVLPTIFRRQEAIKGSSESLLIKLCDLADGIRFIRLHGVDVTARHAQEGLEAQLANKFAEAGWEWPAPVFTHAFNLVVFYAYETADVTGNSPQAVGIPIVVRAVAEDVARRSGDQPGGA